MFDFHPQLKQRFAALRTGAEFFSLRYVRESGQYLSVRKNVAEPPSLSRDEGAMLTVRVNGVEAYAATNDLSQQGLQAALERAELQARRLKPHACSTCAISQCPAIALITFRPISTKPSRP
jgi:predicted Zn-dependent protease